MEEHKSQLVDNRRRHSRDRYLFYGLLALLVFAPLPLGSNRPWALAILEIWIFSLATIWLAAYAQGYVKLSPAIRQSKAVIFLFYSIVLIMLIQVTGLPSWLLGWFSEEYASTYSPAWSLSGVTDSGSLSLDPFHTSVELLESFAYATFFVLLLLLVKDRQRMKVLLFTLIGVGFFEAFLASLIVVTGNAGEQGGSATGTFVNRNHLAGYLEMSLALGIGLLIAQQSGRFSTWRRYWMGWLDVFLGPKIIIRILLVVMVIALVLTRSRMGNMAFFAGMALAGIIYLVNRRDFSINTLILLASLVLIDVIILGTFFDLQKVVARIEQTSLEREKRDEVSLYTTSSVQKFPVFGTGAGSFYSVFPQYRGSVIIKFAIHAENDYLELVSDLGVMGAIPFALIVMLSLRKLLSVQRRSDSQFVKGLSFGCLMGISCLLIHSFVDFNLHIPANSLLFVVLVGICWMLETGIRRQR